MFGRQRQGHQQCGQELAGHITAHRNRLVQPQRGRAHTQGWVALVAQVVDDAAQFAQRVHQIADWSLMHALHALEGEVAAMHGQGGGERTHGRPRVAHEKLDGLLRPGAPAKAGDGHHGALHIHTAAQLAQGLQHHPRVIGIEQVVDHRGALAQCREQQHPVGDALGARQGDCASSTVEWGKVQKRNRVHGKNRKRAGLKPPSQAASPHIVPEPVPFLNRALQCVPHLRTRQNNQQAMVRFSRFQAIPLIKAAL